MSNPSMDELVERVYKSEEYQQPLKYLEQVKTRFQNNIAIYDEFLKFFRSYYCKEIDEFVLISQVLRLFRGHPDLISGFAAFIPPAYRRQLADFMT